MSLEHSPARQQRAPVTRAAYSVDEFCEAYGISRCSLYTLWKSDIGPEYLLIGSRRRITVEAAKKWAAKSQRRARFVAEQESEREIERRRAAAKSPGRPRKATVEVEA
jgi:hypothetical protein